ncbi:hypothetical protein GJAV_G00035410 [Gymnothorax javanicus]|nr:hypothetical protein GJAV_G00035410 [Gymnothorax javanicus]
MGGVMAALSLETRRRFSRRSFLRECRLSTARYHRSVSGVFELLPGPSPLGDETVEQQAIPEQPAMGIQGMELFAIGVVIILFVAVLKQFGILEPMSLEGKGLSGETHRSPAVT